MDPASRRVDLSTHKARPETTGRLLAAAPLGTVGSRVEALPPPTRFRGSRQTGFDLYLNIERRPGIPAPRPDLPPVCHGWAHRHST